LPPELENEGGAIFELPLRRADIADFLDGLAIETASRYLNMLRKVGIVPIENISTIRNMAMLFDACETSAQLGSGLFTATK
jgi:DNA-binding transcriptional regulator LsrR (DeoR family)